MKAITVIPRQPGTAQLDDIPEPTAQGRELLVETLMVGVCGADREILEGLHGEPVPGASRLVMGHECLGRVLKAPRGASFVPGDLIVPIVRRPDPEPCPNCAAGDWDMCLNGRYTECGMKGLDGFARERFALSTQFAVKLDPTLGEVGVLVEPASIVAKAWEHIERIGRRARWSPRHALITGAGPVGLLAALMGVERGLEVLVLDRETNGPKPELARAVGASFITGAPGKPGIRPDVIVECTGSTNLVFECMEILPPGGILCLVGSSSHGRTISVDASALNRQLVMQNNVIFGTVNANRRHYEAAAEALVRAPTGWLSRLITRHAGLDTWREAFFKRWDDVKTAIRFAS